MNYFVGRRQTLTAKRADSKESICDISVNQRPASE
jgi:hypothetical protein